jgi:hypothetical protein
MRTRIIAALSVAALTLGAVPLASAAAKSTAVRHSADAASHVDRSREGSSPDRPGSSIDRSSPDRTVDY